MSITSHLLEWPLTKIIIIIEQKVISVGNGPLCTEDKTVKWCIYYEHSIASPQKSKIELPYLLGIYPKDFKADFERTFAHQCSLHNYS
jgi:hypothetical protein